MMAASLKSDIIMTFVADPIPRNEEKFTIYHNATPYIVDPVLMSSSSLFFRSTLNRLNTKTFSINDLHSESAFSTFIDLCTFKQTHINSNDKTELLSLIDEWECENLKQYILEVLTSKILLEESKPIENETITITNDPQQKYDTSETNKDEINQEISHQEQEIPETQKTKEENDEKLPEKPKPRKTKKRKEKTTGLNMKIHVKTRTGCIYLIKIQKDNTVLDLKKAIQNKTGISESNQVLFHGTERFDLEEDKTLSMLNITDKSKIYVERNDNSTGDEVVIYVQKETTNGIEGEKVPFYVSLSKTVKELVQMIENKIKGTQVSALFLINEDFRQQLNLDHKLKDYFLNSDKNLIQYVTC